MKEDKKIGYLALIVGAISLGEAWLSIIEGYSTTLDIFILGLGLVASLLGIALIIQNNSPTTEE